MHLHPQFLNFCSIFLAFPFYHIFLFTIFSPSLLIYIACASHTLIYFIDPSNLILIIPYLQSDFYFHEKKVNVYEKKLKKNREIRIA